MSLALHSQISEHCFLFTNGFWKLFHKFFWNSIDLSEAELSDLAKNCTEKIPHVRDKISG